MPLNEKQTRFAHAYVACGGNGRAAVSFPPKTGPLFLETEGGCDGSETLFG